MPYDVNWTWLDQSGKKRTRMEIDSLSIQHMNWLEKLRIKFPGLRNTSDIALQFSRCTGISDGGSYSGDLSGDLDWQMHFIKEPGQLIINSVKMPFLSISNDTLVGSTFIFSDLRYLIMSESDFSASSFCRDKLDSALFYNVLLFKTSFWGSTLNNSRFTRSKMQFSHFGQTELDCTQFWLSDLSYAVFDSADLTAAQFLDCNLSNATFKRTNMHKVVFQPNALPEPKDVANALNLRYLTYQDDPVALMTLKNQFKNAGFLYQAKEVNYALRSKNENFVEHWVLSKTCDYGLSPFRPLLLWTIVFGISMLYYACCCRFNRVKGCQYSASYRTAVISDSVTSQLRFVNQFRLSFALSLERSLRLGFKEFSPASALKLLLPEGFRIEVHGFPRFVAGLQALLSVMFITLSLLSYFTNFFDISKP